ncbi:acetoin utilization protein [Bryobacterales bacterium F-183]|nr:acetoin utilization protein [Bryobacterales bacterium F-183]
MQTALLLDPLYKKHDTGHGHPERADRYDAVTLALSHSGLLDRMPRIQPRVATDDELALVHGRAYIELARKEILEGAEELSTGDTTVCKNSLDVALRAVGGVLNAVDRVFERNGDCHNAFCAVRPPGHHASPNRGMGFCIFNNVAVAAKYAQKKHGAERVLIADWDVHHGNGTQDAFYRDGSVLFFSTHQAPWYPGTGDSSERGDGKAEGKIINRPFAADAGRQEVFGAFHEDLQKAASEFKPDLVLISAGFDSRAGDPLGRFRLTDDDFRDLTHVMLTIAEKYAGGRLVSLLEGGYSLNGLAAGVKAHVQELVGLAL